MRYVLEGGVRKACNRLRITGQLDEAESGAHLWARRRSRGCFWLQDWITGSMVGVERSVRRSEISEGFAAPGFGPALAAHHGQQPWHQSLSVDIGDRTSPNLPNRDERGDDCRFTFPFLRFGRVRLLS
jgi:hypothetical protein